MAINFDNDHLFSGSGSGIIEYNSATEGNAVVRVTPAAIGPGGAGVAVDVLRDRMYGSAGINEARIDIFDLNTVEGSPPSDQYKKIGSIEESSIPSGELGTGLSIAVDEGSGNVFVLDGENCHLYEFEEDGTYVQEIDADFLECVPGLEIGVDNGPTSPNGKLSEEAGEGRFLYVPSNRTGTGHSYAFFVSTVGSPEVKSIGAANVSEDEAELQGVIDPNNLETNYNFEYKVEGAAIWASAGGGRLPAGNTEVEVSAPASGLNPDTTYEFRLIANNEAADPENGGQDEAEGTFTTYPVASLDVDPPCANALLRTGLSALLPDCRAYELVTPADTNARAPRGIGQMGGVFTTRLVSSAGDKVPFRVEGGSLPGLGGTGSLFGDPYLATRTGSGWSTTHTGPSASEASDLAIGATSPDQGYLFWRGAGVGSAVLVPGTSYIRYPDGHSELLGQGSLGEIDPAATGRLISEKAAHIVFDAEVKLEPLAAPDGTGAIYDRAPDGTTHVISLKPGNEPFGATEDATYQGASLDGTGIAFKVGSTLYLRYDNEETFTIGSGVSFAGLAEGGKRLFYLQSGDLKAFEVGGAEPAVFADTAAEVVPVTVSADGSTAYFVSQSAIAGSGPNPESDEPQAGKENLYRSVEGQIDFVGAVTERDVDGTNFESQDVDGLGLWVEAGAGSLGRVPARTTPDGSAFLFKSRAALTGYDPDGHAQIYRYAAGELECLSCIPTGAAASSDATLQSEFREGRELFSQFAWPENLRADGRRAFFESSEALVASDSDGLRDVYEWEDQGVGSCKRAQGCVYLISSPQSRRDEYLWAVSSSGDDAFFLSSELLVGSDADETPSIYDARVGGGFAEEAVSECEGEGCRPNQPPPPLLPGADTRVRGPGDQTKPPKRCPKAKHKVKKNGKVRCVKNKNKKKKKKKGTEKNRAGAEKKRGSR
ncbi:MAG TPA: fibronectin type III domain-containing protein [Solirubrobacterales bacterium]